MLDQNDTHRFPIKLMQNVKGPAQKTMPTNRSTSLPRKTAQCNLIENFSELYHICVFYEGAHTMVTIMVINKLHPAWMIGVIILLVMFRFVPHPPNVTPIAAMALFSGVAFSNRVLAYLVPLIAMLISDFVIGFHDTVWYVYASVAIAVLIGSEIKQLSLLRVGVAAIIASIIFFITTNFGAWLHHDMYTQNANGLLQAYIAGLPFFRNSLIANLIFSYLMFYGLKNYFPLRPLLKQTQ